MAGFNKIKESVDGIGNSIQNVTRRVVKWGLAIFGIRSAYLAVRQAASTISQYNEQIGTDIEYIRFALASTLQPVIEGLIKLAYKLLTYVGYIAKAWFGVNIFANASNKAFAKGNKQAKEMKKQLAGFDEMNVLSDNSSASNTGAGTPSFDLSAPEDVPIPSWIQWIADNKDIVIAGLLGIAAALIAISVGANLIMATGIGLIVMGLVLLIKDIVDFIKDPSWDKFANILRDIALILAGISLTMIGIGITMGAINPVAWIMLIVAAIVLLVALIIKHWDKIKETLGKVGQWIYDHIIKPVGDFFKGLWDKIINGAKNMVNSVKNFILGIPGFVNESINRIGRFLGDLGRTAGDIVGGAFKGVVNGVLRAIENILNSPIRAINGLIGVINKVPGVNLGKLSTFRLPRLAKGGIINMPGRGVPVGGASAIAGERGQEGVLPLTDSQQMDLLGQAIARHMVINNFVDNYIDGRKLNRILQSSNDRTRFAMNG